MSRVFRIVHGREQHGERGRIYEVASSGRLSGFVYAYLGMQDDRLPMPIADLVPQEVVADYSIGSGLFKRVLLPHYCSSLCYANDRSTSLREIIRSLSNGIEPIFCWLTFV
jgi:hypothetical protein